MTIQPALSVRSLAKTFTLHNRGGVRIPVFDQLDLDVFPGECVVLAGDSGVGKSTLMRTLYGNYVPSAGTVHVLHDGARVDITHAPPHVIVDVRKRTLGYVSQFLRVIPRVPTLEIVMEPLLANGVSRAAASEQAGAMLGALRLPEGHWALPPATFSGGEQQRVNIARSFISDYPVLLLDEPTASLDSANRAIVVDLIKAALGRGVAMVGIFHDEDVRKAVGTRSFSVSDFKAAA